MSYPAYPEMKGSGVEWLGDVPKHWACFMLKRATRFAYGESLSDANREEGAIPVYGSNGVVGTHNEANTKSPCLIIGRKGSYGKVSYSKPSAFAIDTAFFVDKTQTHQNIRWLYYLLSCLNLDGISQDTGVPGLSREDAYSRFIAVPSKTEQQQIAAFLDRKTAELDAVIRLKERQLELLAEKRQALISQAVTRGLDPNAPLKPSGIPWLGDVPEHWEVNKICWLFGLIGSGTTPASSNENYYDGDFPWVNTGELNDGVITETKKSVTEEAINTLSALTVFPAGTLLIALYGATIGKLGILNISATTNQACCALGNPIGIKTKFMFYWFLGNRQHIIAMAYGGGQPNISQELVKQLRFAVPPLPEQQAIVAYLDTETARMEGIGAAIKTQIETLREYRQALVSAAVTGKIDVRGEP
jgi:type I restriction enzyme S subunit